MESSRGGLARVWRALERGKATSPHADAAIVFGYAGGSLGSSGKTARIVGYWRCSRGTSPNLRGAY